MSVTLTAAIAPSRAWYARLLGVDLPPHAQSRVTVFEVLPGAGAPRRVAALVPLTAGLQKGTLAVLAAHPSEPEAAVLDARVSPAQLDQIARDPRWHTARLPTDASVAGGYAAALGAFVLGAGAGALVAFLVAVLIG